MLVSVIVPVFNVQNYLRECIESIIAQTFQDFELILVDDGSTDSSGVICDEYAKKYTNIRVIHKVNGGLADARNAGIKESNGKYICFIDSDDYIANDYIEFLYRYIKKNNSRISACGFCRVYEDGQIELATRPNVEGIFKGEEAQKYLCVWDYYGVSACNKMFDIKLFHDILFPVGKNSEDSFVMYKIIEKAGAICYNSENKYFYRQRRGSITKSNNINNFSIEANEAVYYYYLKKKWNKAIPYAAQALAFIYIGIYDQFLKGSKLVNKKNALLYRKRVLSIKKDITYKEISKLRKIQLYLYIHNILIYNVAFKILKKLLN